MISVGITDLNLNNRRTSNEKNINIDNVPNYDEAVKLVNKFVKMLMGQPALEIYIYIDCDEGEFISDNLLKKVIKRKSKVKYIESFCRSFDTYGVLLTDDIHGYDDNKYLRDIIDYMDEEKGSDIKTGDIVFCECDKNFHIVRFVENNMPVLSDYAVEIDQVCDYMPLRFIHKVPKYIIEEMNLNILYECEEIVKASAPSYNYSLSEIRDKYGQQYPWLRI